MNSQYYMLSLCFSLRSTATGELALCYLTVYSSYSIWTADTQAVTEVPLTFKGRMLHKCHAACIPWWPAVTYM